MGGVGGKRECRGVAVGGNGVVDEESIGFSVEVREQSSVSIAWLCVDFEAHFGAFGKERRGERRGFFAKASRGTARVDRFGRVDPEEPHAFDSFLKADFYGVAIDDGEDGGVPWSGVLGGGLLKYKVCRRSCCCERENNEQQRNPPREA